MSLKFLGLISVNLNTCAMKEEKVFLLNSISDVGCSIV